MLNKYAYPWDDEIMAECRERKAHVIEKHGGWENYMKHIDDEILRPDGTPWPKASPEKLAAPHVKPVRSAVKSSGEQQGTSTAKATPC